MIELADEAAQVDAGEDPLGGQFLHDVRRRCGRLDDELLEKGGRERQPESGQGGNLICGVMGLLNAEFGDSPKPPGAQRGDVGRHCNCKERFARADV